MTGTTPRVALVTGSGSGIGAATASPLAARGMRVVVNYLHSEAAAGKVVAGIEAAGGQAMAVRADDRDEAAVAALTERVGAAWGGIDVLAPAALFCYLDRDMGRPQRSDVGMYLQTVMLLPADGVVGLPPDRRRGPVATRRARPLLRHVDRVRGRHRPPPRTGRAPLAETVTFVGGTTTIEEGRIS